MRNHAIEAHAPRSLFIQVNGIVVAGGFGVVPQLILRNRWLDKWRERFSNASV